MNNPLQAFEIELPAGTDPALLQTLEQELSDTKGVDQCGPSDTRALDPASLTMWITLVSAGISSAAALVPVVKQVIELFRRKGIKGAKIKLSNGMVLEADEISPDDLLKLSTATPGG